MPLPVAQLMVNIGANATQAEATMTGLAAKLGSSGMLAMAAVGAGAVLAGVGVIATHMAGDFQAGITSLATGAGESTKNLKMVSAGILQLSKDTGTSTKQLVDGMYMIESGGFHGAAGLAILKAAAEGAKVGNADLGVVADTVDTILKNYGEHGALTATQATNALITTVANGKTHLEDLAQSLAFVLPAASAAGLGLKDVMGAMATLTSVGIPAAEASTYLRQTIIALEAPASGAKKALAAIGITTTQLGNAMKHGLPDALQLIETQLAKHGIQRGSAAYVAAIREISGGTRQMQGMLNLMGPHLETFRQDVGKIGAAAGKSGNQVQGWNLVQKTFNQQLDKAGASIQVMFIQLGQKLLPVATQFVSWLSGSAIPAIQHFASWITGSGTQVAWLRPILIGLGIAIAGALVAAFVAWAVAAGAAAVATIAATWPILLIGAGIALLIAGIILAVQHWKQITEALGHFAAAAGAFFGHIFGAIGNFLGGVIAFVVTWGTRFLLAITAPYRMAIGFIDAAVSAIAHFIRSGFERIKHNVQAAIHFVVGLFQWLFNHNYYFHDLVVGIQREFTLARNFITTVWHTITGWLGGAWHAIVTTAQREFNLIKAVITLAITLVHAFIQERITLIRNFVLTKWRQLQEDARIAWALFTGLIQTAVGTVKAQVQRIIDAIVGPITGVGQTLFNAGQNLITMLINGIKSMAGNVGKAVGDIAGKIGSFLGFHSPTKEGPGATADQWMPNLMKMLASTLAASSGDFGGAVQKVAGTIAVNFSTGGLGTGGSKLSTLPSGLSGSSGGGSGNLVIQVKMDGRKVAEATVPHIHKVIRNATGRRDM